MNEETAQQILAELKSLRRITQITSIIALVILVAVCVYLPIRLRLITTAREPQADSWSTVSSAMNHFDYEEASTIAHRILQKYPNDYFGYAYLGNIDLALGHLKEAEENYARVYELLPTEEHQKKLDAIRKRIAEGAKSGAQ